MKSTFKTNIKCYIMFYIYIIKSQFNKILNWIIFIYFINCKNYRWNQFRNSIKSIFYSITFLNKLFILKSTFKTNIKCYIMFYIYIIKSQFKKILNWIIFIYFIYKINYSFWNLHSKLIYIFIFNNVLYLICKFYKYNIYI